ncbi:hypothetical protein THASP1DRAFT_8634, partial [Thamnocephalis sphaerospora]
CSSKLPDLAEYTWPIVRAECEGRRRNCQSECAKGKAEETPACQAKCGTTYDCDTGKMPPSNLRANDINSAP